MPQRKWAALSINQEIRVDHFYFDSNSHSELLSNIVLEADFLQKKRLVLLQITVPNMYYFCIEFNNTCYFFTVQLKMHTTQIKWQKNS